MVMLNEWMRDGGIVDQLLVDVRWLLEGGRLNNIIEVEIKGEWDKKRGGGDVFQEMWCLGGFS